MFQIIWNKVSELIFGGISIPHKDVSNFYLFTFYTVMYPIHSLTSTQQINFIIKTPKLSISWQSFK